MSEYTRTRAIPNLLNFKIFQSFAVVANPICVPDCPRFLPTHVSTTAKPFLSTVLAIGILGLGPPCPWCRSSLPAGSPHNRGPLRHRE